MAIRLFVLLAVGLSCVFQAEAIISAYNLTTSEHLPFKAIDNPTKGCSEPGSCTYANITLPSHSIRYICGYSAHQRITYYWLSKRQVQTFLIRERVLKKCDIFNFDKCVFFASSRCRRTLECTRGMGGLSYGGSQCFAIVNNRDQASWFYFKVHSEKDKYLAVGNAFVVILTIIFCGLILEPILLPFLLPKLKSLIGRKAT